MGSSSVTRLCANQKAGQDQDSPDKPLAIVQFSGLDPTVLTTLNSLNLFIVRG